MTLTHCDVCRAELPDEGSKFTTANYPGAGGLSVSLHVRKSDLKYGWMAADVCQTCKRRIVGQMFEAHTPI